jgi:hypothetical protein
MKTRRRTAPLLPPNTAWLDLIRQLEGKELAAAWLRRSAGRNSKNKAWEDIQAAANTKKANLRNMERPTSRHGLKVLAEVLLASIGYEL